MSLIDDNWKFPLDFQQTEDSSYREFQNKVASIREVVMNLLDEGVLHQKSSIKGAESQNSNIDLKVLVEQNRQQKADIDAKLEELNKKELEYKNYKQDKKLISQEIKETHEAFLMAKNYYKKFLKIYYTIEKSTDTHQTIFLQFFTESKKETENYSVRFLRDIKTRHYTLIETIPVLKNIQTIQKNLEDMQDVPGTLSFIRECFLKIKNNSKNIKQ